MIYNLYSIFDIKYVSPLWHKANTKALGLSNKVAHISKLAARHHDNNGTKI